MESIALPTGVLIVLWKGLARRKRGYQGGGALIDVVVEASAAVGAHLYTRRDKDEDGGSLFIVAIVNLLGILPGLKMMDRNQRTLETVICSERRMYEALE